MTPEALTKLLAEFIEDQRVQKIPISDIRVHATRADPTLLAQPDARARLHDVLQRLAAGGVIRLPRSVEAYDRRAHPSLPEWVVKPPRVQARPPVSDARVWPRALEPASAIATRTDRD